MWAARMATHSWLPCLTRRLGSISVGTTDAAIDFCTTHGSDQALAILGQMESYQVKLVTGEGQEGEDDNVEDGLPHHSTLVAVGVGKINMIKSVKFCVFLSSLLSLSS